MPNPQTNSLAYVSRSLNLGEVTIENDMLDIVDRDSARYLLTGKELQKRRVAFWELFVMDSWQVSFKLDLLAVGPNGRLTSFR